jgi:hypothetical protein
MVTYVAACTAQVRSGPKPDEEDAARSVEIKLPSANLSPADTSWLTGWMNARWNASEEGNLATSFTIFR